MNKKASFDLAAFDDLKAAQEEGISVEILHPGTGEPLGPVIVVAGPDSSYARKADRLMTTRRLRGRKMKTITADELREEGLKKLATCVLSWAGISDGGKEMECNFENALLVFERHPFIAEQVAEVAAERAAFFTS